jgi:hypothetical protein
LPPQLVVTEGKEGEFERELGPAQPLAPAASEPKNLEKGLARLVLGLVDLLVQLLERQAIRRMDSGRLSEQQIEGMGQTFMRLRAKLDELAVEFGLDPDSLELTLPLPYGQEVIE